MKTEIKGIVQSVETICNDKYIVIDENGSNRSLTIELDVSQEDDILNNYKVGDEITIILSDKKLLKETINIGNNYEQDNSSNY